jgi:hypothetical protein
MREVRRSALTSELSDMSSIYRTSSPLSLLLYGDRKKYLTISHSSVVNFNYANKTIMF